MSVMMLLLDRVANYSMDAHADLSPACPAVTINFVAALLAPIFLALQIQWTMLMFQGIDQKAYGHVVVVLLTHLIAAFLVSDSVNCAWPINLPVNCAWPYQPSVYSVHQIIVILTPTHDFH